MSEYQCPFPNCDWTPSRPVDSALPLTRAVEAGWREKGGGRV